MWHREFPVDRIVRLNLRTTLFMGVGAIEKIHDILADLEDRGVKSVLVMTSPTAYRRSGAWDVVEKALSARGIAWHLYDRVSPNPTTHQVDEAAAIGRSEGLDAVIGIGGGSVIDAAKITAALLEHTDSTARQIYEFDLVPQRAKPIVAINTTHGTGTEVDRIAVLTIPERRLKQAVVYEPLYPLYAIDDPSLLVSLPPDQTRYTAIDALSHALESATSRNATPYTLMVDREAVRLIAEYLPKVLENPADIRARYFLLYASMLAGTAIDFSRLHIGHALEYTLSAEKPDVAHGLGLAVIMPAVFRRVYRAAPDILADMLKPMIPGLSGSPDEADRVAVELEKWIFSVGETRKIADLGYTDGDMDAITDFVMSYEPYVRLMGLAPIKMDARSVREIYAESMRPLS